MEKIRFAVSSRSAKMFAAISAVSSVVLCAALIITVGSWMTTASAWAQAAPALRQQQLRQPPIFMVTRRIH